MCCEQAVLARRALPECTLSVPVTHAGVFVYSIATGDTPLSDIWSSYFGNVNDQVGIQDIVRAQITSNAAMQHRDPALSQFNARTLACHVCFSAHRSPKSASSCALSLSWRADTMRLALARVASSCG